MHLPFVNLGAKFQPNSFDAHHAGLEISIDFGPENMWQYVGNLD